MTRNTHHFVTRREAIVLGIAATAAQRLQGAAPLSVRYYGSEDPLPRQIALQAGPLSMVFEPELAQLRYIRFGDKEVVRAIYAAVRDRNWGTVTPRVSNVKVQTADNGFRVDFDVACVEAPIDFVWHGSITGSAQGQVRFDFDGNVRSTFLKNRLGFCVLHPIEGCAGQPVVIGKAKGGEERGTFPADISPHQPFFEIRSIRHTVQNGLDAEVQFEGDVFEMEDHRNWTDASFKTYCTPLGLPFPVEVKQGQNVRQSVSLRLIGSVPATGARVPVREVTIRADEGKVSALPRLGLCMAADSPALTANETQRLRALNLSHLRVDLRLGSEGWNAQLDRAVAEAASLGIALEAALHLGSNPEAELERFATRLQARKPRVLHYLVFHKDDKSTTAKWMDAARAAIRRVDPAAKLVSGSDAYFTEVNRGRPPVAKSDGVCYSVNPQVHAFDNISLVETLAMQAETLHSARKFSANLPLAITTITLKPRFNPNATASEASSSGPLKKLPETVDVRQMSLFGGAWTLGSLKYVAEGGASSATYFETTGWRGVMETEKGNPLPSVFRSEPGQVFPMYHSLADAGEFAGGEVVGSRSSDPLRVDGLLLRKGRRRRLVLANMTPELQQVRISGAGLGRSVRVSMLDEHSCERATQNPEAFRKSPGRLQEAAEDGTLAISLLPYAVARIDAAV